MKRYLVPPGAFLLGTSLIAGAYFAIFTALQGWDYAYGQFSSNRAYVIPIWLAFGVQAAIYAVLRFRLLVPNASSAHGGALLGTSGGTSITTMVACCLHHIADVLPILGISVAATFHKRYQRPFMRLSLALNLSAIAVMPAVRHREWRRLLPSLKFHPALEMK